MFGKNIEFESDLFPSLLRAAWPADAVSVIHPGGWRGNPVEAALLRLTGEFMLLSLAN